MKRFKKWLMVALVALIVAISFGGAAIAISMFVKNIAALGSMNFTNECQVTGITVLTLEKAKVTIVPTAKTVADRVYTVHLYIGTTDEDLIEVANQTVSWSAQQISAGTQKNLIFTGLNLASITKFLAEVTH